MGLGVQKASNPVIKKALHFDLIKKDLKNQPTCVHDASSPDNIQKSLVEYPKKAAKILDTRFEDQTRIFTSANKAKNFAY